MLIVRRRAEQDIQRAYKWYESKRVNLGVSFLDDIEFLFQQIELSPKMFPVVKNNIRRALCRKFPYSIYFIAEESDLVVLTVLHQKQDNQSV